MNKKFLFLIVVVILLLNLSFVRAAPKIEINSPTSGSIYNVGDQLAVDGQITLDKSLLGASVVFKAYSKKYNLTAVLSKKYYNFQENTPVSFSQINKGSIIWEISKNTQVGNDWKIIIEVDKSPFYSTVFESGFFSVSKTLPLSVSINSYLLNTGEVLEASGTAVSAKGLPAQGTGNILLEHSEVGTVHSATVEVKDGYINLQYPFNKADPPGIYTLTFKVTDSNGNIGFKVLTGITLSSDLQLICSIPTQELLPGDVFPVTGVLLNIHNVSLDKIPVTAYLFPPNENFSLSFEGITDINGNFQIFVETPRLAEPGQYLLRLIAKDDSGNTGTCEKNFFLNIQRNLVVELTLDNSWYYNESTIGAEVKIRNRGNIDMVGKVSLLFDGVEVTSEDFATRRGLETVVTPFWVVDGTSGEHTIVAVVKVDNKVLFQTQPQQFSIFPKPIPKKILNPSAWQIFIIAGIVVIAVLVYLKKKDIRDYMWHLELKRKYGIGK